MKKALFLAVLSLLSMPSFSSASLNADLKYGMHSASVTELQNFLISNKFLQGSATGYFYSATLKAVKSFQSANKISPTGLVGPMTRAKINSLSKISKVSEVPVLPSTQTQQPIVAATPKPVGPPPSCTLSGSIQSTPIAFVTDSTTGVVSDSEYGASGTVNWTSSNATKGSISSYFSAPTVNFPIEKSSLPSGSFTNLAVARGGNHATAFVGDFSNDFGSTQCTTVLVSGNQFPLSSQYSDWVNHPIDVRSSGYFTSTTTPVNSKSVYVGSFAIQANSYEAANLNDIFITFNGTNIPVSNFKNLRISQGVYPNDSPLLYKSDVSVVNDLPLSFTIDAGKSVVFNVFADVGSAVGTKNISMAVQATGGASGIFYSDIEAGQSITIVGQQ